MKTLLWFASFVFACSLSMTSNAVPISMDTWYVFSTNAGGVTGGCAPADPTSTCVIPVGAIAVGKSPWTFSGPSIFEVVDGFSLTDRFRVFDSLVSIGETSVPGGGGCGSNIAACLLEPNASKGAFILGAGNHSITIQNISGNTSGAHFFRVTSVYEPASLALLGLGLIGLVWARRNAAREHVHA